MMSVTNTLWRPVRWLVILALGAALLAGCTTNNNRILTIGVVNFAPLLDPVFEGFKEGMKAFGYEEGVNVRYVYGGAANANQDVLLERVKALDTPEIDLIFSISTPATQRAKEIFGERKRIVFASVLDPVGAKVVDSIRQPGGNITGIRHGIHESKRFEWLMRVAPNAKRIYAPFNPNDGSGRAGLQLITAAAQELGVEIVPREAKNADELSAALNEMPQDIDAIFVLSDNLIASRLLPYQGSPNFYDLAVTRQIPFSVPTTGQVKDGGMMAFAFDFVALGRQSARLVDQVLRGVKPGNLPVEAVEFTLEINLQTARTVGVNIPQEILQQADVIYYTPPRVATPAPATGTPTAAPQPAATQAPTLAPTAAPTERTF